MKDRPSLTRRAQRAPSISWPSACRAFRSKPENAEKGAAPGTACSGDGRRDAAPTGRTRDGRTNERRTNERRTNDHRLQCQAQSRAPGSFRQQWRPGCAKNGEPRAFFRNWLRNFLWNSGKRHRNPGCESFRQAREGSGPNSTSAQPKPQPAVAG